MHQHFVDAKNSYNIFCVDTKNSDNIFCVNKMLTLKTYITSFASTKCWRRKPILQLLRQHFVNAKNLYNSNGMCLQTMKTCVSNKNISINLFHNCQTMQSNHKKIQLLNNKLSSTSKTSSFKFTKKAMTTNIKLLFIFQQRTSCFLLLYKKQNSYKRIDIVILN